MSNLKKINSDTFCLEKTDVVLEGVFEKITPSQNTLIDEDNVLAAVDRYKKEFVETGEALGCLNDGFLTMPIMVEHGGENVEAEQIVEEEKDPAFMVLDIWWNRDIKSICGAIVILDTIDGLKIKNAIAQGVGCFISATQTETYATMDEGNGRMYYRISNINGYKISMFDFHNRT